MILNWDMGTNFRKLVLFIDKYGRGRGSSASTEPHKRGTAIFFILPALMMARMCFAVARFLFRPGLRSKIRYSILGAAASGIAKNKPSVKDVNRIHVIGYLKSETGLGESARSTIRAFDSVGIHTTLFEVPSSEGIRCAEPMKEVDGPSDRDEINLIHLNPDGLLGIVPRLVGRLDGRYNIGYWVWEVTRWPSQWNRAFDLVHEIWSPTSFSQGLIARHTDIPVVRIPHNVAPKVPDGVTRKSLGLPERGFLFLGMGDFRSIPERKNPLGAIEAYSRAFGHSPKDIYFILKATSMDSRPDVSEQINEFRLNNPSIILFEGYLDRPILNGLINCSDCYVSLHRSEGFGLPIAEAMYMGKPVIATGYSGNMDFMDESNSLPVRYSMTRVGQDIFLYPRGSEWAEPDVEHAAELMQQVVNDEPLRLEIGERAKEVIRRNFSPEIAGRLMAERLNLIAKESVKKCNYMSDV